METWKKIVFLVASLALAINHARAYVIAPNNSEAGFKVGIHKVPLYHNTIGVVADGNVIKKGPDLPNKLAVDDINGGPAQLSFNGGRLVLFQRNESYGNEANDRLFLSASTKKGIKNLWRKVLPDEVQAWRYWRESGRLRLWFPNPNGAGALFAEITIAFLALLVFGRFCRIVNIAFVCVALIAFYGLVMTGSRGGVVSLIVSCLLGGIILVLSLGKKDSHAKAKSSMHWSWIALIAILIIIICSALVASRSRFGSELFALDKGNMQRINAWKAFPAMLAAAPDGWGDKCGIAYCEWFQPMGDRHVLYYLVNTHLTWMAAFGHRFAFCYILLWAVLFALHIMHMCEKWSKVSFLVWVVFFVSNWFSTLGFYVSLWALPIVFTVCAAVSWFRGVGKKWWHLITSLVIALSFASGAFAVLLLTGRADLHAKGIAIKRNFGVTFVGSGDKVVYVVPDHWVLSRYEFGGMGRDIRTWCLQHPGEGTVAVVASVKDIPRGGRKLCLVGKAALEFFEILKNSKTKDSVRKFDEVILISPPCKMRDFPDRFYEMFNVHVYEGEFLAEITGDDILKKKWLNIVPECELYVPNWVNIAMGDL